jgi:hypothetical protein
MGETEQQSLKQRLIAQDPKTMEPLMVRLMPDGYYELVDGEHRWRIAKEIGWTDIEVFVLEADDLTAKTRCVSSSLLRGHVNWFKLAEVVKQDLQNGVNLFEAYKDILSDKAIQELFSLDNLVPKARLYLEEAVKKFTTITLSDLHIISQFPAYMQEKLAEEYKTYPITSNSLAHTLNKYTKQTQPPTSLSTTSNNPPYPSGEEEKQSGHYLPERFNAPWEPNDILRQLNLRKQQQKLNDTSTEVRQNNTSGSIDSDADASVNTSQDTKFHSPLSEGGICCGCGQFYKLQFKDRIQLKNLIVTMQKENMIFEHIDLSQRAFLIYCDRCNSTQTIRIDNTTHEGESVVEVEILCRNCTPMREGLLDVTSGDAVWFG